jgi:hypothetical protein
MSGGLRSWYIGLLAGLLPVLLLGFLYSALADRLAFVGWALALAAAWVLLLRHAFTAGWSPARRTGAMALLAALGSGGFAALEAEHQEILDLGFRAVLPAVYHPAATRPETAGAVAAALALLGSAALLISWRSRRRVS